MNTWAKPVAPRDQLMLYKETYDDVVVQDHPIRQLDALLREMDWECWERMYDRHVGQPPIHPMLVAGSILYGLMKRIRSSRGLEDATRERIDFIWFLEGRTIDHSTFAKFRVRFKEPLKGLIKSLARSICEKATAKIRELIIDGTRVRANSGVHGARSAQTLEKLVERCAEQLQEKLEQLALEDARQDIERADAESLQRCIERLEVEKAKYEQALQIAQERDKSKQALHGKKAKAVRVPVTDPESMIVPNKQGGFAPNYTPTVAVDGETGAIMAAEVVEGSDEAQAVLPAVGEAEEILGRPVDRVLADGTFPTGENLSNLEQANVEAYMPTDTDFRESNPANREDPSLPVASEQLCNLPTKGGQLARTAFVYDENKDCYWCPMGRMLPYKGEEIKTRSGIRQSKYFCSGKADCPLAAVCVKGKAAHRKITRDVYQDARERVGRRMATQHGQDIYRRRAPVVEGTFAGIKQILGVRQFLLRGLEKVRIEWNWVCAAYNLKKLMKMTSQNAFPSPNLKYAG